MRIYIDYSIPELAPLEPHERVLRVSGIAFGKLVLVSSPDPEG